MNGAVENQLVNKWKASEGRSLLQMATGYKSSKDIPPLTSMSREKIHTALMAAGMTPGLGNVADAADALLYTAEGEFGSAGLSAAAMTPIAGQLVSAKRALKAAKKSGEKMVTLYRGVDKWYPGQMVKKGTWVSPLPGPHLIVKNKMIKKRKGIWASTDIVDAKIWSRRNIILEFEVPKKWYDKKKLLVEGRGSTIDKWIDGGLPKEFLKKVHR